MTGFSRGQWFELPTFVWALAGGVILRNVLESIVRVKMFDRAIDVFGNAAPTVFGNGIVITQIMATGRSCRTIGDYSELYKH